MGLVGLESALSKALLIWINACDDEECGWIFEAVAARIEFPWHETGRISQCTPWAEWAPTLNSVSQTVDGDEKHCTRRARH